MHKVALRVMVVGFALAGNAAWASDGGVPLPLPPPWVVRDGGVGHFEPPPAYRPPPSGNPSTGDSCAAFLEACAASSEAANDNDDCGSEPYGGYGDSDDCSNNENSGDDCSSPEGSSFGEEGQAQSCQVSSRRSPRPSRLVFMLLPLAYLLVPSRR
jgi:hypothetical protein